MNRVFAAAGDAGGILHDPATGLTHRPPTRHRTGRVTLDDTDLPAWPTIGPADIPRRMPISLCWSPLVRCNLSCPHCLDDTTVPEGRRRDRAHVAGLLADAEILGVDISGGEPLLLRDLPHLARTITTAGTAVVSVTTNGWHLQQRVDHLAGAVDAVRVSLDGPSADVHDTHRGPGSFSRACTGVRAAVSTGLPVQIQFVLMTANHRHLQAMVNLASSLGAGGLTVLQMLPIGTGAAVAHGQMLTDDQAHDLVTALDRPDRFRLRLRRRAADAGGFTVVRADGRVWRNDHHGGSIASLRPLRSAADLVVDGAA